MKKKSYTAIMLSVVLCLSLLLPLSPVYATSVDRGESIVEAHEASEAVTALVEGYEAVADRWDLANFLHQLVLKDDSGNIIPPDGNVTLYEHYEFVFTFRETTALQFKYGDDGYLRYQLPTEFLVPDVVAGAPIRAANDETIGHYSVAADGEVLVRFYDVDRHGQPTPGINLLDQYTDVTFTLNLQAQFKETAGPIDFDFGNNTVLTVTVRPPEYDTRIHVQKKHFGYDRSTQTIEYEVLISAYGSDISDISLRDTLGGTHVVPYALASAAITQVTVQVRDEEPFVISPVPWVGESNSFVLDFPDVTLSRGESIRVTYTLDAEPFIQAWGEASSARLNYEFALSNGVAVSGKNVVGDELVDEDFIWLVVSTRFMNKWSTQSGDGRVEWHVNIGEGLTVLNGMTVTDTLSAGMSIVSNTVDVYLYDQIGHFIDSVSFPVYLDKTGFTITLPDGLHGRDIYTAYIRYDAEIDYSNYPSDGRYENRLELGLEGDPYIVRDVFVNPPGVRMEKSHQLTEDYIEWTIQFYVPGALYGERVWFEDYLDIIYLNREGHRVWGTAVNQPEDFAVTARRLDGGAADPFHWSLLDSRDPRFQLNWNVKNVWMMFFVEELVDNHDGRWICDDSKLYSFSPFTADTLLTITYKTPLSARLLEHGIQEAAFDGMSTIGDVLRQTPVGDAFGEVRNAVFAYQINNQGFHEIARDHEFVDWPIHKSAAPVEGTEDTFEFTVLLRRDLFLPGQPALFVDEFDSGMEYVPDSLVVQRGGDRFVPRTDGGADAILQLIEHDEPMSRMTVDFSAPYMRRIVGDGVQPAEPNWFASGGDIVVRYQMRIKDTDVLDQQIYQNIASVYSTTRDGSFSDEYQLRYGTKIVDKTWDLVGNIAHVDILINPEGRTLTTTGQFEVLDQMSDSLSLYFGTIRVLQEVAGEWQEQLLTQVPTLSGELWTFAVTGGNEVTFVFPDSVPLRLQYEVLIRGNVGEAVSIANEVTLAGRFSDRVSESFVVTSAAGGGSANRSTIALYKYDSLDSSIFLPDATFALYIGVAYHGWQLVVPPEGVAQTFTVGTMTFYYMESRTTDDAGNAQFTSPWLTPSHNAIYALVEVETPTGYYQPVDPVTLFSYTVATTEQLEAFGNKAVEQVADSIMVPNDRYEPFRFDIPLTGGMGTVLFIAGGLVVIGAVAVIWYQGVHKKRRKVKAD